MPQYLTVPHQQLQDVTLQALLEEFASREGTEYGEQEVTLGQKVARLQAQLVSGDLQLLYDVDSEQWDLLARQQAEALLAGEEYSDE